MSFHLCHSVRQIKCEKTRYKFIANQLKVLQNHYSGKLILKGFLKVGIINRNITGTDVGTRQYHFGRPILLGSSSISRDKRMPNIHT